MKEYELITRHLVMSRDLNAFGNLYGGTLLAWLDESAYLFLQEKIGYSNLVTVNFDDVNFQAPGHLGDTILLHGKVLKVGKSSVTTQLRATVFEPSSALRKVVISCKVTFVALDRDGKVFPYFCSESFQTWQKKNGVVQIAEEDVLP